MRIWTRSQSWLASHRPQPLAVLELRAGAAGQRLVEAAAVADLADDHAVLVPDAQRALAAAVADAVGRDLVGREHEVAGALLADAGLARVLGDERADAAERLPRDRVLGRLAGRVGERRGELRRRAVGAAVARALGGADPRVRALGLLDHVAVEVRGVVGADEVEAVGVGEGVVEQRLVALALDELGGAAAGPDRLADAAQRAGAAADEVAPRRDDAGRVVADVAHVDELDALGGGAEALAQRPQLRRLEGDHHRLAGGDALLDERGDTVQERLGAGIEHGFVAEHEVQPNPSARYDKLPQCGGSGWPCSCWRRASPLRPPGPPIPAAGGSPAPPRCRSSITRASPSIPRATSTSTASSSGSTGRIRRSPRPRATPT